jgi:hypothetical protein
MYKLYTLRTIVQLEKNTFKDSDFTIYTPYLIQTQTVGSIRNQTRITTKLTYIYNKLFIGLR